jgi:hypothetical protein
MASQKKLSEYPRRKLVCGNSIMKTTVVAESAITELGTANGYVYP